MLLGSAARPDAEAAAVFGVRAHGLELRHPQRLRVSAARLEASARAAVERGAAHAHEQPAGGGSGRRRDRRDAGLVVVDEMDPARERRGTGGRLRERLNAALAHRRRPLLSVERDAKRSEMLGERQPRERGAGRRRAACCTAVLARRHVVAAADPAAVVPAAAEAGAREEDGRVSGDGAERGRREGQRGGGAKRYETASRVRSCALRERRRSTSPGASEPGAWQRTEVAPPADAADDAGTRVPLKSQRSAPGAVPLRNAPLTVTSVPSVAPPAHAYGPALPCAPPAAAR